MKKLSIIVLSLFITLACITSTPSASLSFDEKVETQVALAFTSTALDEIIKNITDTPVPTPEATLTPTSTATLLPGDPKESLGTPSWEDDLSTGKNWSLDGTEKVFGGTKFFIDNGRLVAQSETTTEGYIWWLNFRQFQNAYLEAKFEIGSCKGNDQYGLVFRSVEYEDGNAYYYVITCDGKYDIRRRTDAGSTMLLNFPVSEKINSGANQVNTLGIWMKNDTLRLYMNGQFLEEVMDKELSKEGHFGLFINAAQTPGLTIKMDEIAYWLLD